VQLPAGLKRVLEAELRVNGFAGDQVPRMRLVNEELVGQVANIDLRIDPLGDRTPQ
jgi:hypothetical protein